MSRKYTKLKQNSKLIEKLHEEGKTHREIADRLGVTKNQIKWYFTREHIQKRKAAMGVVPRAKGRPPKDYIITEQDKDRIIAAQKYAITRKDYRIDSLEKRIEMLENFVQLVGRK